MHSSFSARKHGHLCKLRISVSSKCRTRAHVGHVKIRVQYLLLFFYVRTRWGHPRNTLGTPKEHVGTARETLGTRAWVIMQFLKFQTGQSEKVIKYWVKG